MHAIRWWFIFTKRVGSNKKYTALCISLMQLIEYWKDWNEVQVAISYNFCPIHVLYFALALQILVPLQPTSFLGFPGANWNIQQLLPFKASFKFQFTMLYELKSMKNKCMQLGDDLYSQNVLDLIKSIPPCVSAWCSWSNIERKGMKCRWQIRFCYQEVST